VENASTRASYLTGVTPRPDQTDFACGDRSGIFHLICFSLSRSASAKMKRRRKSTALPKAMMASDARPRKP
jgi:hypothetical protein